jgi:hypothetical protein
MLNSEHYQAAIQDIIYAYRELMDAAALITGAYLSEVL